jgi:hypothetical protein
VPPSIHLVIVRAGELLRGGILNIHLIYGRCRQLYESAHQYLQPVINLPEIVPLPVTHELKRPPAAPTPRLPPLAWRVLMEGKPDQKSEHCCRLCGGGSGDLG